MNTSPHHSQTATSVHSSIRMADKYATKFQSTTYTQRLEASPEALSEFLAKQVRRSADVVRILSGFVFLYYLLALGLALLESTRALLSLDKWGIVENGVAGAVHALGLLAGSLGFYSAKTLTYESARRFANVLLASFFVYFTYLGVWTVLEYESVVAVLQPIFVSFPHPEAAAGHFLCLLFLLGGTVAGYFLYTAYGVAESIRAWKVLNPRTDMSIRSLSVVLDK